MANDSLITFPILQSKALSVARQHHLYDIVSAHEGYAVIQEEVDELWEIVKKKAEDRRRPQMLEELLHIAAMAQRMAEDLNLLTDYSYIDGIVVVPHQQSQTGGPYG